MQSLQLFLQAAFVVFAIALSVYYSGKGDALLKSVSVAYHGKTGCNPVLDVHNVTLHYFAGRGRAEPIRMLMEEQGVSYTEKLYTSTEWTTVKQEGTKSGLFTFGQVPAIETAEGIRLSQSYAIVQYLGRATGLDCDCEELTQCQIIALGIEDARSKLTKMLYSVTFSLSDRDEYLSSVLPVWLGYFEKLAPELQLQEKAYFSSNRLTWVDFLVFDWLENNVEFARFDFGPNVLPQKKILADFPKLNNFFQHMAGRPNIARYRTSKERLHYSIPKMPVNVKVSV